MKPAFFIDRPIFSAVLSILIVILGFIGAPQPPPIQGLRIYQK